MVNHCFFNNHNHKSPTIEELVQGAKNFTPIVEISFTMRNLLKGSVVPLD